MNAGYAQFVLNQLYTLLQSIRQRLIAVSPFAFTSVIRDSNQHEFPHSPSQGILIVAAILNNQPLLFCSITMQSKPLRLAQNQGSDTEEK
jgi:hypothetical protein